MHYQHRQKKEVEDGRRSEKEAVVEEEKKEGQRVRSYSSRVRV
jgi:hypothetical protein